MYEKTKRNLYRESISMDYDNKYYADLRASSYKQVLEQDLAKLIHHIKTYY